MTELKSNYIDREFCLEKHRLSELNMCSMLKRVEARINSMDRALDLKTLEVERRLEGLNELRSEVIRDRDQFARRETFDDKVRSYDVWITQANEKLTKLLIEYESRITQAKIIAVIGVMVSIATFIFHFIVMRK